MTIAVTLSRIVIYGSMIFAFSGSSDAVIENVFEPDQILNERQRIINLGTFCFDWSFCDSY